MARLTVEDCLSNVKNRFELVLKAAQRARLLEKGAAARVDWENDKPTVVALREIEKGLLLDQPKAKNEPEEMDSESGMLAQVAAQSDENPVTL